MPILQSRHIYLFNIVTVPGTKEALSKYSVKKLPLIAISCASVWTRKNLTNSQGQDFGHTE
jgi:hypothetical protein